MGAKEISELSRINSERALSRDLGHFESWMQEAHYANPGTELKLIVKAARWAPSGDNIQPYSIEITGADSLRVRIDRASENIYDYRDGEPTLLAVGTLLESTRIAASVFGRRPYWTLKAMEGETTAVDVSLPKSDGVTSDSLLRALFERSVERRAMKCKPLSFSQKEQLAASVAGVLDLRWYEPAAARWRFARLNALATAIRFRCFKAFEEHLRVIDWKDAYSKKQIPVAAIGLSRPMMSLMRWTMGTKEVRECPSCGVRKGEKHLANCAVLAAKWKRMALLNTVPAATFPASFELDYIPGICCGAFFSLALPSPRPEQELARTLKLVQAGAALQRFWLTAAILGLGLQPCLSPLIFGYYGRHKIPFTEEKGLQHKATQLNRRLCATTEQDGEALVFLGRLGSRTGRLSKARSIRRDLEDIIWHKPNSLQ